MKARWSIDNLTKEQKDVVIRAAKNYYLEEQKQQVKWMWAVVLWHLHEKYGWKGKVLNENLEEIYKDWIKAEERYELDNTMRYGDLCILWLERLGVDVEGIFRRFEG